MLLILIFTNFKGDIINVADPAPDFFWIRIKVKKNLGGPDPVNINPNPITILNILFVYFKTFVKLFLVLTSKTVIVQDFLYLRHTIINCKPYCFLFLQ